MEFKDLGELLGKIATSTPDKIAIERGRETITYKSLEEKTNQIANFLQEKGAANGNIPVIFENSIELVEAIVGIIKAGGIFAPIDPNFPHNRINLMLQEISADWVITQEEWIPKIDEMLGNEKQSENQSQSRVLNVLVLDSVVNIAEYITENTNPIGYNFQDSRNLKIYTMEDVIKMESTLSKESSNKNCYIYFTSGSTGKPKGILGRHMSLAHFINWEMKEFAVTGDFRVSQLTSPSFDPFLRDTFLPLCCGGTLCIPETRGIVMNPKALAQWLEEEKINLVHMVPTLFRAMMGEVEDSNYFKELKYIMLAGELLRGNDIKKFVQFFGTRTQLVNLYGPTETTLAKFFYRIKEEDIEKTTIPVGKPIPGAQPIILNDRMKSCRVGTVGEVYIRTPFISSGYYNNRELTREVFILNPLGDNPKDIIYKTGDTGRLLPSGDLEILGRVDFQVKIRGHRIEVGEIENRLLQQEYIKEAVVVARETQKGEKVLWGYITGENPPNVESIKESLGRELPDYMIPTYIIPLEKMPLTPNGKVDRRALPEVEMGSLQGKEYIPPSNEIEGVLVKIWQEILGVEEISIEDDFFNIGGHSLNATSMTAKIHEHFNVEVPLKLIFKSPTIKAIAEYIGTQEKGDYSSIQPIEVREYYPVSSPQKRIYTLQQFNQEGTGYNIPGGIWLEGRLEVEKLEMAFQQLIQRHESLRTSFSLVEGEVVQIVHREVDFKIEYLEATENNLETILNKFVRPFQLEKPPLIRVGLIKVAQEKHLLVFDIHHGVSDGTSNMVLIKEFSELYRDSTLEPLRIQYKDYANWYRERLSSEKIGKQRNYWMKQLEGEIPVLNLMGDFPRPALRGFEGARVSYLLEEEFTGQLREVCKETGTTLYMLLLSAYNILLSKYSGQEEIIVGSPIAGRQHGDLKKIIGMFVNTLAMRNYPKGEKTFREFLEEVKENALGAYENQDYQFEELVENLDLERDLSRNPLFDVMFTMQNMEMAALELEGLTLRPYNHKGISSKFDMTLTAVEVGDEINLSITYSTNLFKQETIERLYGHLINILKQICENKDLKLSEMELTTWEEKHQLLEEFNATKTGYPRDKTLHQLFEEQVDRTPDQIAIVFGNEKISYGNLNERANSLATVLRNKGVKANSLVGIVAEASIEMMMGILAVLKAGGAYLPIDVEFPRARREYILEDSQAMVVLTHQGLVEEIKADFSGVVVSFEESCEESFEGGEMSNETLLRNTARLNLQNINQPQDLVYSIYTSGTTGKGKGVLITHNNLVNYTNWFIKESQLHQEDKTLLLSSFAFDLGYTTLFSSIITGAELHIMSKADYLQPEKLLEYIAKNQMTYMKLTPSHYRTLVESPSFKDNLESLRLILLGGEVIKPKDVEETYRYYQNLQIMNHYGPTETTIGTIAQRIEREEMESFKQAPTIGYVIDNAKAYMMNKFNQVQPIGVPGELCISGEGVGKGYLNRPDLTEEKFVPHPVVEGERLYRTGDLARYLPNGKIQFLGRIDHQVKIRGYRIELGEIEAQLMNYGTIEKAVVVPKEDVGGNKYLYGYIVAKETIEMSELRKSLLLELPDYMVPSYILQLEEIPLTPNGKVDLKALPEVDGRISAGVDYEAPRNEIEETLVGLWQEVLAVEGVGISHNFFDLGGHSLKAISLVSKINQALKVEISLQEIFKYPTIKGIAELIEATETKEYLHLEAAEEKPYYPLSAAQRRLYTLQQLEGESVTYNMPRALMLEGNLDVEKIESSFIELIKRHESLRTSFKTVEGEVVQYIQIEVDFTLRYMEADEEELKGLLKGFIKTFDLTKGPLMRVAIVKVQEEKHLLMVDLHHIISDGVSMGILIKEFTEIYGGRSLKPLRLQYKDYSEGQRQLITSGEIEKQREYWLQRFEGELPVLNLMGDYPRASIQSFEGNRLSFTLDEDMTNGLRNLCRQTGATLYMVLLSAYNILLAKYSRQEDIIVGSPIAGRQHGDLSNIMGMFVNTLAMRNFPEGKKSFIEFLEEVKKNSLSAFENQDYQFEELVEHLNLKRDISRNPLFDVVFTMQNMERGDLVLEGLSLKPFEFTNAISKFDMSLSAMEENDNINLRIEYATKIFKADTIERLFKHLENILKQIIENSHLKLSEIQLATDLEKQQIFQEFNNTKVDFPRDKTAQQLFEEQVLKTPDNIAVVFGEETLTYQELDKKAHQLARFLIQKGVKANTIVGIMVEASLEMMVGIMGILKAGGAYLPIDPEYPTDRIQYMLKDSGSNLLLTQSWLMENIDEKFQGELISLDAEEIYRSGASSLENTDLEVSTTSRDLAYVIYTSGSTGKPKGVMVEHSSLVNLCCWHRDYYKVTDKDRCTKYAGFAFDASVWETIPYLLVGAAIYIVPQEIRMDVNRLNLYFEENSITISFLPTQICEEFLEIDNTSLRLLLTGGDKLRKYRDTNYRLFNNYGPTENTVVTTSYLVEKITDNIPIGKPIANSQVLIVDEYHNLLPIGVAGELWIGGAGLARGYLNQPELTKEKFIDNPFKAVAEKDKFFVAGEKIYRTGDLARLLPDGNIEFLGRIDHQVKIRGYRIELGEIENQLLKYPSVEAAVVLAKEDVEGTKYLCGYIVAKEEIEVAQLRQTLLRELPDYMVPSFILQLERMPLTPNGKIDTKALPDIDGRVAMGVEYEAPTNATEEMLVNMWEEILGVEGIGINHNFFELGGHSLKATTMMARIQKIFNVEIPLREIFKTPTIKGIAEVMALRKYENIDSDSDDFSYSSIEPIKEAEYYPASPAQKRLYTLQEFDKESCSYNMPMALMLEGELEVGKLEKVFEKLIERHESFRTSFKMVEGGLLQQIHPEVDFEISYREVIEEEIEGIFKAFIKPFDLTQPRLLRVALIKVLELENIPNAEKHLLVLDLHHIICDGVSMGILVKEFSQLYRGIQPAPLRVQYKDFSHWQQGLISSGKIDKQKDYWLQQLQGEIPVLNLVGDYPRPALQSFEGDYVSFQLERDLTQQVKQISKKTGTTLYMVLLSAFNVLLSKYTGQEDIIVGSPISGRQQGDTENIIGMFVNTLAMRNYPKGEQTFGAFLEEVKKNSLEAYENQDYQFEELVSHLNLPRDISRNPLFDVMFTMQNMEIPQLTVGGLSIKSHGLKHTISKFDLTLLAMEQENWMTMGLQYATKIFKRETIEKMATHFKNILVQISRNLDIKLSEIELTTEAEKHQLLEVFNNTRLDAFKDKTLHQLFEEQVEKTPDATAVIFEEEEITYSQLNSRANQLARVLVEKGVKGDDLIGIMAEPSLEMIVGILGILKAGGGYLPIDPTYPQERINYMLKDSGIEILLTQLETIELDINGLNILQLDAEEHYRGADGNIGIYNPQDLAYCIYTSGSTGNPKGVLIQHKAIANTLQDRRSQYSLQQQDNVLVLVSYGFDGFISSFFTPLISGGKATLLKGEGIKDIMEIKKALLKKKITHWVSVPSLYGAMLESVSKEDLTYLKVVTLAGEKTSPNIIEKSKGLKAEIQLINEYGPTENSVITTLYKGMEMGSIISIGKPISNTKIYILNSNNQLQPVAVAGEICIAGDGLAKGYLNRPDLTAEKFIESPFVAGEKIYKTGDLGRWLSDGNIELLGRIDQQVKIRGFRIELGEIENQLLSSEGIKEAVVLTKGEEPGNQYLCGYIVAENEISVGTLREGLSKVLPEYMIPQHIIQMERLPLTPNGKIDMRALPEVEGNSSTGVDYEAPRDEVEETLVELWQEVLGVNGIGTEIKIGINHNFFELGGHSLKATALTAKIHKVFNIEIPLREVFKTPTIRGIAEIIKLAAGDREEKVYSAIQPVEEKEYYPVSSAQSRLYTLQQLDKESRSYNMPGALMLEGDIEVEKLELVFKKLIERHESFRTSFKMLEGGVVQYIHPEVDFKLSYQGAKEEELEMIMSDFIKAFDLTKAPLLRGALVEVSKGEHLLIFDLHHIISDGVSMGILVKDFVELYRGIDLEPLSIQYKDYSHWQQNLISSGKINQQKDFWLQQLQGEIPVLNLMGDYPRPALQSYEGEYLKFQLDRDLTHEIRKISRTTGATLYMVLLSAFNVLLSKYTAQEDIIVGSPISGRQQGDLDRVIGMFVNTLVMRNYPKGEKTFREFLEEVKKNALAAYENQDYQFEELVNQLKLPRDLSRNPLFDVMFTLQNMDQAELSIEGLSIKPYGWKSTVSKFDLTLSAVEQEDGLLFGVEYATKIFKKETIERLIGHLRNILQQISRNLDVKLSALQLVTEDEKHQLLEIFNDTKVEDFKDKTLHQLFEEQVEKTPDAIALMLEDEEITYGELNKRANQLARVLIEKGIKTVKEVTGVKGVKGDCLVGIMTEPSVEMIVGILGILKAGAGYLPIDPTYPKERINFMLQDSGIEILLTQSFLQQREKTTSKEVVLLDQQDLYMGQDTNLDIYNPQNLAYCIYTSGTTGNPKGVLIQHKGITNTLQDRRIQYNLQQQDRVLVLVSYGFDGFVSSFFTPLISGAGATLLKEEGIKDVLEIKKTLLKHQITHLVSVPSLYGAILESASQEDLKFLRGVTLAGEKTPANMIKKSKELKPDLQLVNEYGPTENSVITTMYKGMEVDAPISIGKPIANTKIYILNNDNQLQPVAVAGELWITGDGLAKGYLNRPDLTAEKFIESPFVAGEKIYKTGDLGRWLSDGNIELLGRVDQQVKIRGFRIELGEIETQLLSLEVIKEAVVITKEDEAGNPFLCGYVVAKEKIDVGAVKKELSKTLPEYMIPQYIMELKKLPLTPNGKIDLKGLLEVEGEISTGVEYEAPRDATEEILVELWEEILGVKGIGINDNFFELGGHSLKATTLVAKIHKNLKAEVPLREVFKTPTIRGLAEIIKSLEGRDYYSIEAAEEKEYYPASSAQRRIYTLQQLDKESCSYNMPTALMLEGRLEIERLEETFEKIIKRHEALRTSFKEMDGDPVQLIHHAVDFKLQVMEAGEGELEGLLNDFVKPFDLGTAPLLRIAVVKVATEKHLLIFDMNHIISDGTSMGILVREFAEIYHGVNLTPLRIQYKDYSEGQRKLLATGKMEEQKNYWLQQFEGELPVLNMMGDYPRPAIQSFEGDRINYRIDEDLTNSLKKICRDTGTTMYMLLLSAYNVLLSKYSGQEDIIIGSPIAGRPHGDLENIMGIFINTLAMRNYPVGEKTFQQFLEEVKKNSLSAYENQDYQFEELVEDLKLKRDISRNPLFDVMFTMQNMEMEELKMEGLSIKSYPLKNDISKFDLSLSAVETEKGMRITLEYGTKIFKKETIERLYRHFVNILRQVSSHLGLKLKEIELITEEEQQQIIKEFNETKRDYPREKTIHQLFEEQARRTPHNIAVIHREETLTYQSLNEKANQLARLLVEKGTKTDGIVAIMVDRSFEMMVGLMAILKAGGAYLPIDPEYPVDRIQFMLEDSGARLLLTQSWLQEKIWDGVFHGEMISLDEGELYQGDDSNLALQINPQSLAYIIYTSGSTGKPKGVMIQHFSLVNRLNWMQNQYPLGAEDVILQKTPFTFDVSLWELFWWSMVGAKVCMLEKGGEKSPKEILEAIEKHQITTMHFVPSMLSAFLEYMEYTTEKYDLNSLKKVFASGEALTKHQVEKFHQLIATQYPATLTNLYGPTEATVDVSYYDCDGVEELNSIPIGKPIDNIQLYILNPNRQLQPIGVAGELYICGDGLARGYLNRPELTDEKFIDHLFLAGEKMYRTGDLARWMPNRNIEFLGRIDHQVKIRGFRIELGEIENLLLQHGEIKEAVVVVKEDSRGGKLLCGYITATSSQSYGEIKSYLSKDLPEYMIPTFILQLEKMPLTSNGKVDRRALPEPEGTGMEVEAYEVPRNEIEKILVNIWQNTLGVENIGIADNFFALGGDSIKAIQVSARLQKHQLHLKTKDLLLHPTIKELSGLITRGVKEIDQGLVMGETELSPIQQWFWERDMTDQHHWNQSIMIFNPLGFEEEALKKVITKIVEHHDQLRAVYPQEEARVVQWIKGIEEENFTLDCFDFRNSEEWSSSQNIEEAIKEEANHLQGSINLSSGPLLKLGLFKTTEGDHLLIVLHHLVVDGVSWRILLEDISIGYQQMMNQQPIALQEKTNSYKEWGHELKLYADSPEFLKEIHYWRKLTNIEVADLPKDMMVEENKVKDALDYSIQLSQEDTEKLLRQVNKAYNTEINDILLTAFGLAIRDWTGNDRVLINLEGHGREQVKDLNISRTVGWFTSLYPFVLEVNHGTDLSLQIKTIKEGLRGVPNKGIGYGILKYLTSQENKEGINFDGNPEIVFNYLGQFDQDINSQMFGISPISNGNKVSPEGERSATLDVNGLIAESRLRLTLNYNGKEYHQETIKRLGEYYRENLKQIIHHCIHKEERELTPSDTTAHRLDLQQFEEVMKQLELVGIEKHRVMDLYPLSPTQRGMLFHALADGDSRAYFEQTTITVEGDLDINLLEMAFNGIIDKHDVLKTVFIYKMLREPMQAVLKSWEAKVRFEDISMMKEEEKISYVDDFKMKDWKQGFDLSKDQPIRISVLKLKEGSFKILWSHHHIIMDGWCLSIITRDLFRNYQTLKENKTLIQSPVNPYSSFIKWMEEQDREKALEYWKDYLQDYETKAEIPFKVRNHQEGYDLREKTFTLSETVTNKLKNEAGRLGITINTILQTVWGLILQKYNNVEDVVFGSVVSGRPAEIEGIEGMVGLFINTIPVRMKFDYNNSYKNILQEVQKNAIESSKYEYLSLVEIQGTTELKGDLIDHILVFENFPVEKEVEGLSSKEDQLEFKDVEMFEQTNYHFNIVVAPGDQLAIRLSYNRFYYEEEEMVKIVNHFKKVIEEIINNPEGKPSDIEIVTEEEKFQLLEGFNATETDYPREATLCHLFEAQVEKTPNEFAILFGEEKLTYQQLNSRANQLARTLVEKGVKPETIVALMVERSIEMVVGILGILKAGGGYLPIDPSTPQERAEFILKDSNAVVLLTRENSSKSLNFEGETLLLDTADTYSNSDENLEISISPDTLAYVIYTSGSTGQPKGVMIEHSAIINRLHWMQKQYPIGVGDRILQKTPYTFDVSVWELLWWGLTGASVCMLEPRGEKDPEKIVDAIEKYQITTMHFVPSMLNFFLEYVALNQSQDQIKTLKQVFSSGEALTVKQVESFSKLIHRANGTRLINLYGPTEAAIDVSYYNCSFKDETKTIPIGKPIDNIQLYVVDQQMHLQPVGVAGELCIAGVGLARGYLNREELTKEKFVRNPFTGGLMYRTGDLAKYRADGNIEYLGRIDFQVKIRGYRIELGEIESRLQRHEAIKDAVVVDKKGLEDYKYLCAYIVTKGAVTIQSLKEHLAMDLPEYMIPAFFVEMEELPLSSSGKINRKLLPEPIHNLDTGTQYVAATNEEQEEILTVWQEVLGNGNIGIKDDFFTLGGDSFKALRVVSQLNGRITLGDLFRYPTVELLWENVIQGVRTTELLNKLTRTQEENEETPALVCVPYGGGSSIIYKPLADALAQGESKPSLYSIDLPGHELGCQKPLDSVANIAEKCVEEIKRTIQKPIVIYSHCVGSGLAIEIARLLEEEGYPVKGLCIGAMLPVKRPLFGKVIIDGYAGKSDKEIHQFLKSLGGFDYPLEAEELAFVMKTFRHDVAQMREYYFNYYPKLKSRKLKTPIFNVFGDKDALTKDYNKKYKNWKTYGETINPPFVLKDAGHYYIKSHSEELAEIIEKVIIKTR